MLRKWVLLLAWWVGAGMMVSACREETTPVTPSAPASPPETPTSPTDPSTQGQPNIVVFLSDDLGWGQPGFNGGSEVATPNLDRIAHEGVKLTQFYVQPVCTPSRAALMTGRYPWKTGTYPPASRQHGHALLTDERTLADALRDAGYATWLVGKWHLGQWQTERLPLQRGFDHHYGFYSAEIDPFSLSRTRNVDSPVLDWHRNGRPVVESGYSTFLLADEAVALIERHDGSRPFFLVLAFNATHVPHGAPDEYVEPYAHLRNPEQRGMLKAMDVAIGQVVDVLERRDVFGDTLVMFLNDNGGPGNSGGNAPYRGNKSTHGEGGVRVPAAMRWPGRIRPGSASDALLHVVDLFPTFTALAEADATGGLPLDGFDAWEAIAEGAPSPRQEVVHSLDVIRVGDWKLIDADGFHYVERGGFRPSPLELFNISEDPYETTNLAGGEPERIVELRRRLAHHRQSVRIGEGREEIPNNPPVVYGAEENAVYGAEVRTALAQRAVGNLGPTLLRIEVSGTSVTLAYSEPLDTGSVPPASAFTLAVIPGYHPARVTGVEVSGSEVVLTMAQVLFGDVLGLTYEVPETGAIRDLTGLAANGVTWMTN